MLKILLFWDFKPPPIRKTPLEVSMLKPTLLVGLVLLQYALAQEEDLPNDSSCLDRINSLRAEYAHKHQIASMNELNYDNIYETVIRSAMIADDNWDCPKPTMHFPGNFFTVFSDINNDPYAFELLISMVDLSELSCWKRTCEKTGEEVLSVGFKRRYTKKKHGIPGTFCMFGEDYKGIGLCSLPPGLLAPAKRPEEYEKEYERNMERPNARKLFEAIQRPSYENRRYPADAEARANGFHRIGPKNDETWGSEPKYARKIAAKPTNLELWGRQKDCKDPLVEPIHTENSPFWDNIVKNFD